MSTRRREWIVRPDSGADGSSGEPPVRVFVGHAGSVIWFAPRPGPVRYGEACITAELADRMRAWEATFDEGFDLEWSTPDAEARHTAAGVELARALSDELGDAFDVEVDDVDDEGAEVLRRMRGRGPGTNPDAVVAFDRWRSREQAEAAARRAAPDDGSLVGYTPLGARRGRGRRGH